MLRHVLVTAFCQSPPLRFDADGARVRVRGGSLLQHRRENEAKELSVFEEVLWRATEALRFSMDVTDYKHIVLGLFFLRYLSDASEERCKTANTEEMAAPI